MKKEIYYKDQLQNLVATPKEIEFEKDKYSFYQNYLYKRALYGLSAFSKEDLEKMCAQKKQRINKVYIKGQIAINVYKQEKSIKLTNSIFDYLCPDTPLAALFKKHSEVDQNYKNTLTFKDLNITKDDIINLFVKKGVLPNNFMSLVDNPTDLPKLKV